MGQDNGGGGAVLMAFALGAIAGAAVALLWAPASGEETRRLIKERAGEAREKAGEAARQSREFLERQRETLGTAIDRGKEAYQRARTATPEEHA
jgi:gas vesicle protein